MTEEKLKKMREAYHALSELQSTLEKSVSTTKQVVVWAGVIRLIQEEYNKIESEFPGLIPIFRANDFATANPAYYNLPGVLSYLGLAIGKLKVNIDSPESSPVTETKEFPFVKNSDLRKILERDYTEIQKAYVANCWKSVIILSGGAIEAILMDLLLNRQKQAVSSIKAPKKSDITQWDLAELIAVAVDLRLVSSGVEKLSSPVREYRNLVHPGNEVRNKLKFDAEEAKIALEVLHIVHRDLSNP